MIEFKIGDTVKVIDAETSQYSYGDVGVVVEDPDNTKKEDQVCVLVVGYDFEQIFDTYQLELVYG